MIKTHTCKIGLLNVPAGGSGAPHKMCCYLPVLAHTSTVHSEVVKPVSNLTGDRKCKKISRFENYNIP